MNAFRDVFCIYMKRYKEGIACYMKAHDHDRFYAGTCYKAVFCFSLFKIIENIIGMIHILRYMLRLRMDDK